MKIKIDDDVLITSTNKYVIVDRFKENGCDYVFIVDIDNNSNFMYGKITGNELEHISNPEELEIVIRKVYNHLHKTA